MSPPLSPELVTPDGPYVANAGEFEDPEVRRRFVSRVFAILSLQLAFTVWLIAACVLVEDVRKAVCESIPLAVAGLICFLVSFFALLFGGKHIRRGPIGVILLLLLTVSMAYVAAVTTVQYSNWTVLYAACITAIICLTISIFTGCCKLDVMQSPILISVILLTTGLGVVLWFVLTIALPNTRWVEMLGAIFGSTLFITCLLLEMQAILGGRLISVSPDEVIYAASQLYTQIVFIYYFLLMWKF